MVVEFLNHGRNSRFNLIDRSLDLSVIEADIFPNTRRVSEFNHIENLHDHGWIIFGPK